MNVHKLLSPLKRLRACKPKQVQIVSATTTELGNAPTKTADASGPPDCLLNYFYDIPIDEVQVTSVGAYVDNPRSVHFAFRNAHLTLGKIFQSKWADCRDLIDAVLDRQLNECKDRRNRSDGESESEISAWLECIDNAREALRKGYDACSREEGAELLPKLQGELRHVRTRWTALDKRFFELERKYGTARSPNFLTSRR